MKTISQVKTLPCNVSIYHYFMSSYIQFGKVSELQGTVSQKRKRLCLFGRVKVGYSTSKTLYVMLSMVVKSQSYTVTVAQY